MRKPVGLHKFGRDQRGASVVEFALLAPVLLALLLGTVTLFDLFRNLQSVDKATFTVGDMMSREQSMNRAKLGYMLTLMNQMVPTSSDGGLRLSSISKKSGKFVVNWSEPVGHGVPTTPVDTTKLPNIAEGDSVLLTESFVPHRSLTDNLGIGPIVFTAQAAHRPRFVTTMSYSR